MSDGAFAVPEEVEPSDAEAEQTNGVYACIDIGSNTTRLLVAEVRESGLTELLSQRSFTRIGKEVRKAKRISGEKIAETAEVVSRQARLARELGARELAVVATAALRKAKNGQKMTAALERAAGLEVRVLSGEDEGRLAFIGATKSLGAALDTTISVVDVGGGSTEIATGTVFEGPSWVESLAIGSGLLADAYLRSDPPSARELQRARDHCSEVFQALDAPATERAVAVGGSAASLRRLVGAELEPETLERSLRIITTTAVDEIVQRFDLDAERVRLLPAGILIFEEVSRALGLPLQVCKGGLREGVILELAAR